MEPSTLVRGAAADEWVGEALPVGASRWVLCQAAARITVAYSAPGLILCAGSIVSRRECVLPVSEMSKARLRNRE